jgi:PAS domain S-box-containing protein
MRLKRKSKKTARTVTGRSNATRRTGEYSKSKREVDDRREDSSKLSEARQGRGEPLGQSNLAHERIGSVKKNMAQQRAQRRRMGKLRTTSEAVSHEIAYATAHTARRRAEEQLRLAEDRARLILDSSLDAVVTIDASNVIAGWSKSAEGIFGWSCQEAVGKHIVDTIIPMQHREAHLRGFEHFLATGEGSILNRRIEITALHRAGHEFPVELTVTAIRVESNWQFTAFVRDLTDKRRVEEALREARDDLTRVTRLTAMGQLSASIAHEINQPLTAVAANSDTCLYWLSREEPVLGKARAAAQRLAKDARRASEIIARIKALMNKIPVERVLIDINQLIHDVLKLTQGELRKHRITTLADLHEAVPPVNGDRVQLQQVIMNLALNSIESMMLVEDRPRTLSIRSQVLATRMVEVSVHDTGVGLDLTAIDRIFDAFFTTKRGGTGMGLAICRSIIEAHDGQISAAPGTQFGAVFQFSLPIADGP